MLAVALLAGCRSTEAATPPTSAVTDSAAPASTTVTPTTTTVTPTTTTVTPTTTTTTVDAPRAADLEGISMTSVPADVLVPTTPQSLDQTWNPINGRRGGAHPLGVGPGCTIDPAAPRACLLTRLDALGFDVTTGSAVEQERRRRRAVAVIQLDAGLAMTGRPDRALYRYLGIADDGSVAATTVRTIGASAQGRPISAVRYGDGPRIVLVVAETHGDEEAGLRVWLRLRTLPIPPDVTLWVVPTLNPDGLALDTRFLADGVDPNRAAPRQPEQQAVFDFAVSIRPTLSVWYHQNYAWVGGSGASMAPAQRYQSLTQLGALHRSGNCRVGFMWCPIDAALGSSSILVELPDVVTPADVQRHADALLAVAADSG